jgi:hypothetical protein
MCAIHFQRMARVCSGAWWWPMGDAAFVHLWVSPDLCIYEASPDEPIRGDLIQTDSDGRRVYRKLDGLWWRWLFHHYRGFGRIAQLRNRLVSAHGEAAVLKTESRPPEPSYQIPRIP